MKLYKIYNLFIIVVRSGSLLLAGIYQKTTTRNSFN